MNNQEIKQIAKLLLDLRKSKRKALNRRETREKYLQKLADIEYQYNKEQWESLQQCIKHQQEKRLSLTCELLIIKDLLVGVQKLQKENSNEWYA